VDADLDTLATALYVTIDDLLIAHPEWRTRTPSGGNRDQEAPQWGALRSQDDGTPTARRIRASKVRSGSAPWRKIKGLAPKPTA
jgi:hypothetical protein